MHEQRQTRHKASQGEKEFEGVWYTVLDVESAN
jgi:hypothetical protein